MAVPGLGFSISELITAGLVCKNILSGFTDKYDNSSRRLQNLATNINALCLGLETHKMILESKGSTYDGYESFKLTLQECNDFIRKYKVLLDKKRTNPATWWQTALYTFERDNVAQLQDQISSQMNVMHMSFMNISIKHNVPENNGQAVSVSQGSSGTVDQKLADRISSPATLSARSSSISSSISPSTSPSSGGVFLQEIRGARNLQTPVTPRIDPSPTSDANPSTTDTRHKNYVADCQDSSNADLSSLHRYSVASLRQSPSPSTISLASNTAGDVCAVIIEPSEGTKKRIKLDRMPVIQKHEKGWDIVMLNDKNKPKFKHHILAPYSQSSHPYTEYTLWNGPLQVTFKDPVISDKPVTQSISIPQKNKQDQHISGNPKYTFLDPKRVSDPNEFAYLKTLFFDFQSIIYGKTLQDIYDFQNIYSGVSSREVESSKQQLKVWSDPITCHTPDSYLSFFANNETDKRHLEFPISWFDEKVECKEHTIVKIHFTDTIKSPGKDKPKLSKAYTFQTQSTGKTETETATPSIFSNRRNTSTSTSVSTVQTTTTISTSTSSTSFSSTETPRVLTQQPNLSARACKMRFLKITFTTLAESTRFQTLFRVLKSEPNFPPP